MVNYLQRFYLCAAARITNRTGTLDMGKHLHNRVSRRLLKELLLQSDEPRVTLSFYKYVQLADPQQFRDDLYKALDAVGTLGRIYVASEGVNAQLSVPEHQFEAFKEVLNQWDFFRGMRLNVAVEADGKSFFALIIKVRRKIVADGVDDPNFNPSDTGRHLSAAEFNALTDDPDTILVDMRNHYESEVGHFEGSILPDVATFREELPMVADMLSEHKDKNIVMYCTGGIRCEKASAYMKYRGFPNVFQLEGGIIEYARQIKNQQLKNKFRGKNFVFDERLGERISEEVIAHCHQCGASCDDHINCSNDQCHILFIQCSECRSKYQACCSQECADFIQLPAEERARLAPTLTFNGSTFGKGVYKAWRSASKRLVETAE